MNTTNLLVTFVRLAHADLKVWLVMAVSFTCLWPGFASAELRVLIKFDQSEHSVHRLVEMKSNHAATNAINAMRAKEEPTGRQPGMVDVVWKSVDGSVLHRNAMVDPRLTHAPLSSRESSPALIGINEGAYMVSGPSGSRYLEINLPANFALSLPEQTWQFELNP